MNYIKLAQKYAANHANEGSKLDALWVIALSLLSIAERLEEIATQHRVQPTTAGGETDGENSESGD
jgi:hypothetical protein